MSKLFKLKESHKALRVWCKIVRKKNQSSQDSGALQYVSYFIDFAVDIS